jgi:hypothetical protein
MSRSVSVPDTQPVPALVPALAPALVLGPGSAQWLRNFVSRLALPLCSWHHPQHRLHRSRS